MGATSRLSAGLAAFALAMFANGARADAADALSDHVGYTIIATKTIEAFADRGKNRQDGFEGCQHDRVIIFTDGTAVSCRAYGYSYSYRPKAVILGKQVTYQGKQLSLLKMVVGDNVYDVSSL